MPVNYYLTQNPGTPDPNSHFARVITRSNLTEADIALAMVQRGMAPNQPSALAAIQGYQTIVAEKIADGCAINTALCTIRPTINGVFTGQDDHFDPARHEVHASLYTGPLLRSAVHGASVQKTRHPLPVPLLIACANRNTGAFNATLTPGGIVEIRGKYLKYGNRPGEGIYLILTATNEETRVTTVATRTKSQLMFLCPPLAPGLYRLEVRCAAPDGTLRTGHLQNLLTVA